MPSLPESRRPTPDSPPSDRLEITATGQDPRVLQLRGDVDCAGAATLRAALRRCQGPAAGVIVLDLGGVTLLSAAALTVLVEAHQLFATGGAQLRLAHPTRQHRRIFTIVALDQVLLIDHQRAAPCPAVVAMPQP